MIRGVLFSQGRKASSRTALGRGERRQTCRDLKVLSLQKLILRKEVLFGSGGRNPRHLDFTIDHTVVVLGVHRDPRLPPAFERVFLIDLNS
ncbi:hypothetical protein cypCar_00040649, partial [Cyprinus carpio]